MEPPNSRLLLTSEFFELNPNSAFQKFSLNGRDFAIFSEENNAQDNLILNLFKYNVVVLAPLKAENNIVINAINVVCFSTLQTTRGNIAINATGKIALLGADLISGRDNLINAANDIHNHPIILERLQHITEAFKTGLSDSDIDQMMEAITETYDAAIDPLQEDECEEIDIDKALEFFDIPQIEVEAV